MKREVILNLSVDKIKSLFIEYLNKQDLSENTKKTRYYSAFYLADRLSDYDFLNLLLDSDFEEKSKITIYNNMIKTSKSSNIMRDVYGYYGHLKTLREFLLGSEAGNEVPKNNGANHIGRRKYLKINIPAPCAEQVEHYLAKWKTLPNYTAQEDSLNKLFWQLYPHNDDINNVLAKTAILNDFYSTNIFSTYTVAKHIVDLDIDDRLAAGDLTVVNDIAKVEINGSQKNLYSFATKYCSHHNDKIYPIFDRYVERVLLYFRDKDGFFDFKKPDLKNCIKLCEIIKAFQAFYNLKSYTLKEMDKYMWLLGKEYMPNSYSHR